MLWESSPENSGAEDNFYVRSQEDDSPEEIDIHLPRTTNTSPDKRLLLSVFKSNSLHDTLPEQLKTADNYNNFVFTQPQNSQKGQPVILEQKKIKSKNKKSKKRKQESEAGGPKKKKKKHEKNKKDRGESRNGEKENLVIQEDVITKIHNEENKHDKKSKTQENVTSDQSNICDSTNDSTNRFTNELFSQFRHSLNEAKHMNFDQVSQTASSIFSVDTVKLKKMRQLLDEHSLSSYGMLSSDDINDIDSVEETASDCNTKTKLVDITEKSSKNQKKQNKKKKNIESDIENTKTKCAEHSLSTSGLLKCDDIVDNSISEVFANNFITPKVVAVQITSNSSVHKIPKTFELCDKEIVFSSDCYDFKSISSLTKKSKKVKNKNGKETDPETQKSKENVSPAKKEKKQIEIERKEESKLSKTLEVYENNVSTMRKEFETKPENMSPNRKKVVKSKATIETSSDSDSLEHSSFEFNKVDEKKRKTVNVKKLFKGKTIIQNASNKQVKSVKDKEDEVIDEHVKSSKSKKKANDLKQDKMDLPSSHKKFERKLYLSKEFIETSSSESEDEEKIQNDNSKKNNWHDRQIKHQIINDKTAVETSSSDSSCSDINNDPINLNSERSNKSTTLTSGGMCNNKSSEQVTTETSSSENDDEKETLISTENLRKNRLNVMQDEHQIRNVKRNSIDDNSSFSESDDDVKSKENNISVKRQSNGLQRPSLKCANKSTKQVIRIYTETSSDTDNSAEPLSKVSLQREKSKKKEKENGKSPLKSKARKSTNSIQKFGGKLCKSKEFIESSSSEEEIKDLPINDSSIRTKLVTSSVERKSDNITEKFSKMQKKHNKESTKKNHEQVLVENMTVSDFESYSENMKSEDIFESSVSSIDEESKELPTNRSSSKTIHIASTNGSIHDNTIEKSSRKGNKQNKEFKKKKKHQVLIDNMQTVSENTHQKLTLNESLQSGGENLNSESPNHSSTKTKLVTSSTEKSAKKKKSRKKKHEQALVDNMKKTVKTLRSSENVECDSENMKPSKSKKIKRETIETSNEPNIQSVEKLKEKHDFNSKKHKKSRNKEMTNMEKTENIKVSNVCKEVITENLKPTMSKSSPKKIPHETGESDNHDDNKNEDNSSLENMIHALLESNNLKTENDLSSVSDFPSIPSENTKLRKGKVLNETYIHPPKQEDNVDFTVEECDLLRYLLVDINFKVPKLHRIERGISRPPTKEVFDQITARGLHVKKGSYTPDESQIIMDNWEKFCRVYNFPPKPELFMHLHARGLDNKLLLSTGEAVKFATFLAHGLPNRLLHSVYRRFRTMYTSVKRGKYMPEEDQLILETLDSTKDAHHIFARLGRELNREPLSVHKRYIWLREQDKHDFKTERVTHAEGSLILRKLLDELRLDDVWELKDRQIPWTVFTKIGEELHVRPLKIKHYWLANLHPKLFVTGDQQVWEVKVHLIDLILSNPENKTVLHLDYNDFLPMMDGWTTLALSKMIRNMVTVATELHPNVKDFRGKLASLRSDLASGDKVSLKHAQFLNGTLIVK